MLAPDHFETLVPRNLVVRRGAGEPSGGAEPHLLVQAVPRMEVRRAVELGSGEGLACLLAARRWPDARVVGFEIRAEPLARARWSAAASSLDSRVRFVRADLRDLAALGARGGFDLAIANPPFFAAGAGRPGRTDAEQAAQNETAGDLADFLAAAAHLLRPGGMLVLVLWAGRLAELTAELPRHDLPPRWLRLVHERRDVAARNLLVRAVRGGAGALEVAAPLVLERDYSATRR